MIRIEFFNGMILELHCTAELVKQIIVENEVVSFKLDIQTIKC